MKFPDLQKRLVSTVLTLGILCFLLLISHLPVFGWIVAIFASCVASLGMWEFCRIAQLFKKNNLPKILIICGFAIVLSFYISSNYAGYTGLPLLVFALEVLIICCAHFDQVRDSINSIGKSVFAIIYVALPIGIMLSILYFNLSYKDSLSGSYLSANAKLWFVYLLLVTKITDVAAYFGGSLIGQKKLAVLISPGKTVSGAICGLSVSILTSFLYSIFCNHYFFELLTLTQSLYMGLILGFIGQVGDLVESLFKRDALIKDSNSIPGLGGVLDMVDSLLFTAPTLYIFIHISS